MRRRLDAADAPWLAAARKHTVRAGAERIEVHEWGQGPRTALILHGWGSHAARFAPLARSLVAQEWRVLAIDAPGHGSAPGWRSSLPQFIAALDQVVQDLGPAQALIGHSLGALAAINWLGQSADPDRAAIGHLVLVSCPSGVPFLIDNFVAMLRAQCGDHASPAGAIHGSLPPANGQLVGHCPCRQHPGAGTADP